MSMQNYGCSGYVILASELYPLVIPDKQQEYIQLLESNDDVKVQEFLEDNLSITCPPIESVFYLNDESESETLEKNKMYVSFALTDLYSLVPTQQLIMLQNLKITPKFNNWVIWG